MAIEISLTDCVDFYGNKLRLNKYVKEYFEKFVIPLHKPGYSITPADCMFATAYRREKEKAEGRE